MLVRESTYNAKHALSRSSAHSPGTDGFEERRKGLETESRAQQRFDVANFSALTLNGGSNRRMHSGLQ